MYLLARAIGPFLLIEDGELDTVTMDPTLLAQVQDNQQLGDWFIPIISIACFVIWVFESHYFVRHILCNTICLLRFILF